MNQSNFYLLEKLANQSISNGAFIMRVLKPTFVFYSEIRNFTVAPKRPFVFLQRNTKFYSCTQTAFRFFYNEMQNFENCTQTAIRFSQKNKKFSNVPKLPFILWLQNTKFLKLFRNGHVVFDNKLQNVKLHPNCHSFFDDVIQNLKSYPNGHSFFY